ncbi:ABC transporter permease [Exiguobacterium acetylicum]|uniref:ABC transporter permease n=1 Tax=Exiguobacterium acetylicum TaxID=41170 RepID=UPI0027E120A0|nr:ABC transporter permease [Exiguobacterium acetylicum]MDQ6468834.1 ABC transporter permease [Exiguobacterium acetylicum]
MLGIIIGVASVIAIIAIAQGGEAMLKSKFSGENNIREIYYEPSEEDVASNSSAIFDSTFTEEDVRALEAIPQISKVIKSSSENGQLTYQEYSTNLTLKGIDEEYMNINEFKLENGTHFTEDDFLSGRKIAIISEKLSEKIFGSGSALNKIIYFDNQPLEVIGVLETTDSFFSGDENTIFTPIKVWQIIYGSSEVKELSIQSTSIGNLQTASNKAVHVLNEMNEKSGDYKILNMEEIENLIDEVSNVMTIIIGSIGSISILVGGIGVMNIMLVSVTERTKEIGLRISLGATKRQILIQFLVESMTLTLLGGVLGIILGAGGAMLVSYFAGWPSLVSAWVIVFGLLFSMFIGILFGIAPANRASKMNPIEALNYE